MILIASQDDPLASTYIGRPIDVNGGSWKTLDVAATWFKNCLDLHTICANEIVELPSRVLYLGTSKSTKIRLEDGRGRQGSYAALSYCWGITGNFTTSRGMIAERKTAIELWQLPKTFQDAVNISRKLKLEYL